MRFPFATSAVILVFASACAVRAQTLQSWPFNAGLVGDVDGDGAKDLLTGTSTLFRYYSTRTGALIAQHAIAPPNATVWSLGDAGDVDGDGSDDIFLAAGDAGGTQVRIVSPLTGATLHTLGSWPTPAYGLAVFVARLDDINGDGKAEFMIGDPYVTVSGLTNAGRLDVYDGATGAIVRTEFGTAINQRLGRVKGVGDLDADGKRDYILGGYGMLTEARSGPTGALLFMVPTAYPAWFDPTNVRDVGDINGDGRPDFSHEQHAVIKGGSYVSLYVVSGQSGTTIWSYTIQSGYSSGYGFILGGAGDIDGDGFGDLVLTAFGYSPGQVSLVVSGRTFSWLLEHTGSQGYFGASPGDLNDDGVPDLINWPGYGTASMTTQVVSGLAPGVTPFGHACPDSFGVEPVIGVGVGARLGLSLAINLSQAHPSATMAVLGLGYSDTMWNGVPLPIDMSSMGWNGCQWFISAEDRPVEPMTTGPVGQRRRAIHQIYIPPDPLLLGLDLFSQWAVFESSFSGRVGSVTRAARIRVVPY